MRTPCSLKHARGLSLVELMVAVSIGLLLVLAMMSLYTSSRRTYNVTDEVARMQENARIAFTILDRQLRMAGFIRSDSDGKFDPAAGKPLTATWKLEAQNDIVGDPKTSDRVTIRFFGSSTPSALANAKYTADGSVVNCVGRAIATNEVNTETYFVALGTNGEPGLRCRSTVHRDTGVEVYNSDTAIEATGVELVSGVESMQLLYGDDKLNNGSIYRYLKSDDATLANLDNVRSVRLSLLMRTINDAANAYDSATYRHFGSNYPGTGDSGSILTMPGTDRRLRRIFQSTITLRNRIN